MKLPPEETKKAEKAKRAEYLKPDEFEQAEHNLEMTKVRRIVEPPKTFYKLPHKK